MNYQTLYERLVRDRQNNPPSGYAERHHIIPRCEGGSDDASNLVLLSARDHIFAHLLLAKWKGGVHWVSLHYLFGNCTTPTAQEIRIAAKAREGMRDHFTGRPLTQEHRAKISASLMGHPLSTDNKEKLRRSNVGRRMSAEHRERLRRVHTGSKGSEESKAKRRATWAKKREAAR